MAIGRRAASPSSRGRWLERPTTATGLVSWLTTVDHKRIGILYFLAGFFFFLFGGLEALVIRLQLATPDGTLVGPEVYNQLFTMHGTTMIFLGIMPLSAAFFNFLVPLMIGARDVAFPRLNSFSFWTFLAGGLLLNSSFFLGGAPNAGWFGYAPMTLQEFNAGHGIDFWVIGLQILGIASLVAGFNFIVTIINMRAPGMTMMRMPLFVWMTLVTQFLVILAFPAITIALFQLLMDRQAGTLFFNPEGGGLPIMWQHLFWIFGHPEVYILILPAFGIISEVVPTFARKPLFGYPVMVFSGILIGFMGFTVWSHHMFATGLGPVVNSAFALTTMAIAIPTGVKIFNWLGTLWGGQLRFTAAMLFALGLISNFTIGGISGMMHAVVPHNLQHTDTYFVVAHFHYVLIGGSLFGLFAGFYFWFPKVTGRLLDEGVGKWVFWLMIVGFNMAFFPMHYLGLAGMNRRIYTYSGDMGWNFWNMVSTVGAFILAAGVGLFIYNALHGLRHGKKAGNDPWDGRTLEWTIPSPPPVYNFAELPEVHDRESFWVDKHGAHLPEDRLGPSQQEPSGEDDPVVMWPGIPASAETQKVEKTGEKSHGIHMPGQSWYPIFASASLMTMGYGIIYSIPVGIFGLFSLVLCFYAWAFEGIGGEHLHPKEPA
ncbi:MAG: cytochrome c oxidase subunit I [Deinococcota bacterium]|nr:cytochrome c oxidase subunit I [Deinococcota bacterium]